MGWIAATAWNTRSMGPIAAPIRVLEHAGYLGEYITPHGQKPWENVRLKRNGRIVLRTRREALMAAKGGR